MKKIFFIVSFLFVGLFVKAQTGIGTTAPVNKFEVVATTADPASSGSSANGNLRLGASASSHVLDFGLSSSSNYAWLQARLKSNYGTNNSLVLNPNGGKIGIGLTTPSALLHLQNGNVFSGSDDPATNTIPSLYIYNSNTASASAHATSLVRTAGTGSGKPYYSLDVNGAFGYSIGLNNPTDQMILNTSWNFNTTAANNAIIVNRSGQSRVQIPTSSGILASEWPASWGGGLHTFDINCAGLYYSVLLARSDRRLKNTIIDLDSSIVIKYLQLKPVSYYWNDKSDGGHKQYGFIAQDMETLFPDLVSTSIDSVQTKSINYQSLHALSLKVIQAQQAEIELLKKKQIEFEARLLRLEAKINH